MQKTAQDIIVKPILTERSMSVIEMRKYTFRVNKNANKVEIAKAVEELFGVKVEKVNTLSVKGRFKRMGRHSGYQPDWKKAIVTLTENSKTIAFFDGMA